MTQTESMLEQADSTGAEAEEIAQRVSSATVVRHGEPLAKHTTLRVGGPADVYVEPASEADLATVLAHCYEHGHQFFVLGRGSNLLVKDGGFRGVVCCLAHPHFGRIEVAGERLLCGAGARLKAVALEARRNSLSGLEFLSGVPGSILSSPVDAENNVVYKFFTARQS